MKHLRVPVELQSLRSECGLACLAMVAGYHDRQTDLWTLRRRFGGQDVGFTLKDLAGIARELGYLARGLRAEPEHLIKLQLPAILHWNLDHFVVLARVGRKHCVIHDPAKGRIHCSWNEIEDRFTGVALELWPAAEGPARGRPQRRQRLDVVKDVVAEVAAVAIVAVGGWREISGSLDRGVVTVAADHGAGRSLARAMDG